MIHLIGWIGNIGFIFGVYLLGKKQIIGWYCNLLGNMMYLWQAVLMNNSALIWLSIGLAILNLKGIRAWKEKKDIEITDAEIEFTCDLIDGYDKEDEWKWEDK